MSSAEVVRFGKPVAGAFTFALLDVGERAGIFKRHGLDLEISAFTGGTRLVQAETAGSIDIAFNTGPDMAMIFKGAPVRAVALVSDSPLDLCLLVRPDLAVTAAADLKGKRITVSSPFAMTAWMTRELARQEGWGADGIQLVPSASGPAFALLKTKEVDGITTDLGSGLQAQKRGDAKVVVRFSERVKDLTMYVIFASEKMISERPDTVRRFLAAWFETARLRRRAQGRDPASGARGHQSRRGHCVRALRPRPPAHFTHRPFRAEIARHAGGVLHRPQAAAGETGHEQDLHRAVSYPEIAIEQSPGRRVRRRPARLLTPLRASPPW